MNYKQNEKINQVKESTLVVGIDIGSTTQYARAFDWRGIELGKVFTFSNSREGFETFKAWMQHLQDKYRKSDVIVGIELFFASTNYLKMQRHFPKVAAGNSSKLHKLPEAC